MELVLFNFFSGDYDEHSVISRAKEYVSLVNEAYSLLDLKTKANQKKALDIFKGINKNLQAEYKEYSKKEYRDMPNESTVANNYIWSIRDIVGHLNGTNTYQHLSSNLYDVRFYFRYYMRKLIDEE